MTVAFGNQRLSILDDFQKGHQPMVSDESWLDFN